MRLPRRRFIFASKTVEESREQRYRPRLRILRPLRAVEWLMLFMSPLAATRGCTYCYKSIHFANCFDVRVFDAYVMRNVAMASREWLSTGVGPIVLRKVSRVIGTPCTKRHYGNNSCKESSKTDLTHTKDELYNSLLGVLTQRAAGPAVQKKPQGPDGFTKRNEKECWRPHL